MLWSSMNPLIFKLGVTTSSNGAQYRLKMFTPAQLPCGTLTVKSCSALHVPSITTLKDHGLR